jgi:hypothetical protein
MKVIVFQYTEIPKNPLKYYKKQIFCHIQAEFLGNSKNIFVCIYFSK